MCDRQRQAALDALREGCEDLGLPDEYTDELLQVLQYCPLEPPSFDETTSKEAAYTRETAPMPPLGPSLSSDLMRLKEYMLLNSKVCAHAHEWADVGYLVRVDPYGCQVLLSS